MYKKHSIKTSITIGILLMMIVGLLLPSISASIEIDDGDGFWTDDFDYDTPGDVGVSYINCRVDDEDNSIILNETTYAGRIYDFDEGGSHKEGGVHEAYYYQSFFFLPMHFFNPNSHIKWENEFDEDFEYPYIEEPNESHEDERNVETSSTGYKKYVIHHFRFKLDVDAASVGNLNITWVGKAEGDTKISLYYWAPWRESKTMGLWTPLESIQSDENYVELSENINADEASLALNADNYIDICVVCIPSSSSCTLFTDYIQIISESEKGYITDPAFVVIKDPIIPKDDNFYWGTLTWEDYERSETTVKYHVLYNTSGNFTDLVEDKYFSDGSNEEGFTNSPVLLTEIPYDQIKIMANLTTESAAASPKIFSWGVTWQKEPNKWQDLFNSSFRIDIKNRIKREDDDISINPASGDWPMFGQNSQNTRASDGKGANSKSIYWWSKYHEDKGEKLYNPVISDEYFYICAKYFGNGKLYRYKIVPSSSFEPGDRYPESSPNIKEIYNEPLDLKGSPAIADQYIIVATGETDEEGTNNYIYAFDKEDFSSSWEFPYDGNICYWSSPIVVDDKIFITSWSGDPDRDQSNDNNKLLALELSNGNMIWEFTLPAHGFSTPGVYNDMVIVGCKEETDDSLFALDMSSGEQIWNISVGSIGRSSPVIYDDKVFIVSEEKGILRLSSRTKVTALDATNGSIIWEKFISRRISVKLDFTDPYTSATIADSTPAVHDGVLFVASPLGDIMALDTTNGTELWSVNIYAKAIFSQYQEPLPILSNDILVSSPAYADELLYIGTPDGVIYALNVEDGSKKWLRETYPSGDDIPVVTSPIVSNGLVFIGTGLKEDSEGENLKGSGRLYCIGSYQKPSEEIDGSLTSIPIALPQDYWWGKFYADFNTSTGGNIKFSILDESKNHIIDIKDGNAINLGDRYDLRTIRLQADLTAPNLSANPKLNSWHITFEIDGTEPDFVKSSFEPSGGWLNDPTPVCKIDVWDNGTGLALTSATFTIRYNNKTESDLEKTYPAEYTGVNRTNFTTLTADISSLDISENITNLTKITFSIKDYADNIATFPKEFYQDTTKPTSSVSDETNGSKFTSEFVVINATADDPGDANSASDIKLVELYYRHSYSSDFSGNWLYFDNSTEKSSSWNFTDKKHGGYYELCTIATDNINNVEEFPEVGDVWFILDNEKPDKPSLSEVHWFKELPTISIEFSDDFLLDTIKYQPEFETEWTVIDSGIEQKTYDTEWDLDPDYWDQMADGEEYALYFWINDSLGNTQIIDEDGYKIVKDAAKPNVDLEIPTLETEWSFEDTFTISAFATDGDGSGIKSVELFYQYSEDGKFDGNWTSYGVLTFEPFEWEFEAEEGNGYYEFKVVAEDLAGNVAESEVFSTGINIFPLFSVVAMVLLIIALAIITIVIFIKWRKK